MYVVLTLILLVQVVPDERHLNTTRVKLHTATAPGFLMLSPGDDACVLGLRSGGGAVANVGSDLCLF